MLFRSSSLQENPNAVIAFTGSQMVDEEDNPIALDWDKYSLNIASLSNYDKNVFLQKHMLWKNSIYNASMALFKKECLLHIDSQYSTYKYCGDWLFWVEIIRQGDVIRINKKLNYFRQHTNKVSPMSEKKGLYFLEGFSIINRVVTLLNLSSYQRYVVKGRLLKRLNKASRANSDLLLQMQKLYPQLFKNALFAVPIYVFDKLFNCSKLR